jgi:membrane-associated phospholipid phosphatase
MELIVSIFRMYPLLILFYAMLIKNINLTILLLLSFALNFILKYLIIKPLIKDKVYPILGSCSRPSNAKNCGYLKDPPGYKTNTYGMPSGHTQIALAFSVYLLLSEYYSKNLTYSKALFYILSAISVSYSRLYLNCHTIQQVIIGGMFGTILGIIGFYYTR